MRSIFIATGVGFMLIAALPASCTLSLAAVTGAIAAATTDPACMSEAISERSACAPDFTGTIGMLDSVVDPGSIPAPDPLAATAVQAAIDAVGRHGRYIAEGNGPVDFDCSGLTAFAWRAAGAQIADYSYTQWNQTRRISRESLAPGDLVFGA